MRKFLQIGLIMVCGLLSIAGSQYASETAKSNNKDQKPVLDAGKNKTAEPAPTGYRLGINADNWKGEIERPGFGAGLKEMGVDFIVWHLSPEEEVDDRRLMALVTFSRQQGYAYLFNTELANYVPDVPHFQQKDGSYRYDLKNATLEKLKDDPLFLGVVYDEPMLMQAMNAVVHGGRKIPPYFYQSRDLTAYQAHDKVVAAIQRLSEFYGAYGKKMVFEMVFPDYAHPAARGGAVLAPKLLKENFNDLMLMVYGGAARQYRQKELWACVDLWFLDKFPFGGKAGKGYHTPDELYHTLCYTFDQGLDWVYVEHAKGLFSEDFEQLTDYGKALVKFNAWRKDKKSGDWRKITPVKTLRRFPSGGWGQQYSGFLPDHPYGSWKEHPEIRKEDNAWMEFLHRISEGNIPRDALTWNAVTHPILSKRPYSPMAGLPIIDIRDHYSEAAPKGDADFLDFTPEGYPKSLPEK